MISSLATIVLNYNNFEDTIELVEELIEDGTSSEIIVVDNLSTDLSRDKLRAYFNKFEKVKDETFEYKYKTIALTKYSNRLCYIESDRNGGFSYGNNLGLHYAYNQKSYSHFLILNNDVSITKGFIAGIFEHAINFKNYGMFGSLILKYQDGKKNILQGIGGKFNSFTGRPKLIGIHEELSSKHKLYDYRKLDYPIGACLLIPSSTLEKVGFLCEDFFLYFEELDYVYRMRKIGLEFDIYNGHALLHKCGATIERDKNSSGVSETSLFYLSQSQDIFMDKYHPYKKHMYKLVNALVKFKRKFVGFI